MWSIWQPLWSKKIKMSSQHNPTPAVKNHLGETYQGCMGRVRICCWNALPRKHLTLEQIWPAPGPDSKYSWHPGLTRSRTVCPLGSEWACDRKQEPVGVVAAKCTHAQHIMMPLRRRKMGFVSHKCWAIDTRFCLCCFQPQQHLLAERRPVLFYGSSHTLFIYLVCCTSSHFHG